MSETPQPVPLIRRRRPLFIILASVALVCLCALVLCVLPSRAPQGQATAASTEEPATPNEASSTSTLATTPTRTASPTPRPSPTDTPQPATQTALAVAGLQTEQAGQKTATRQAIEATQTSLAHEATATREAYNAQRTQSARSTATYQALLAEYKRIDIQDLVSYPGAHLGEKIIVRAEVDEIESDGAVVSLWLYSWAGSGFTTGFMRTPLTPESGVLEGYTYNVYGTVASCPAFTFYSLDGYCLDDVFIPTGQ